MKEKMKKKGFKISVLIICLAVIALLAGVYGKKAYDKHLEEVRQEKITAINTEIKKLSDTFKNEEDRAVKLENLKNTVAEYEKYKKSEEVFDECLKNYTSVINSEKKYFENDYNNTITVNTVADVNAENDKDKLNTLVLNLTAFKDGLKIEYENYNTISEDKFNELNTTVDTLVTSYNDRVNYILAEEEAKRQAEEEARKKAEEEAAANAKAEEETAKKNSSSNSSSSSSSSKKNSSSSNNSSSKKNNSSSSNNNSKKNNSSSSSSSSGSSNNGSSSSNSGNWATGGWVEGDDGTRHDTKVNLDTGDVYVDGEVVGNQYNNGYFN